MDVYSELKKAQLEVVPAGLTPNPNKVGMIAYKDSSTPMEINDGTQVHKVLTDKMYAEIASEVVAEGIPFSSLPNNYVKSSLNSDAFVTTSTTFVDVTNMTVTITSTGKPLEIFLYGGSVGSTNASNFTQSELRVTVDGNPVATPETIRTQQLGATSVSITVPGSSIRFVDFPAAGSHTIKLQAASSTSSASTFVTNCLLFVREI